MNTTITETEPDIHVITNVATKILSDISVVIDLDCGMDSIT